MRAEVTPLDFLLLHANYSLSTDLKYIPEDNLHSLWLEGQNRWKKLASLIQSGAPYEEVWGEAGKIAVYISELIDFYEELGYAERKKV